MKTLTELKKIKEFRATRLVTDMWTVEQYDEWVQYIKNAVKEKFGDAAVNEIKTSSNGKDMYYESYIFFAPKVKAKAVGKLIVRSKDYVFIDDETGFESYGTTLTSSMLTDFGFAMNPIKGGRFEYHLEGF